MQTAISVLQGMEHRAERYGDASHSPILYLHSRNRPDYRELVAEVLNVDSRDMGQFLQRLDVARFDALFASLYSKISSILRRLLSRGRYDVYGCSLFNSTWPATLFLLKRIKSQFPDARTVVGGPGPLMGITSKAEEVKQFMDRHEFIDYFVVGEGEPPLMQILEDPELPRGAVDPGRNLTLSESRKSFVKAEEMPAPDYGDLDVSRYLQLSVASSRGALRVLILRRDGLFGRDIGHLGNRALSADGVVWRRNITAARLPV